MSVDFFPLPSQLFSGLGIKSSDLKAGKRVEIDGEVLRALISTALEAVVFNKEDYLRNEDIKAAYDKGAIKNLQVHYVGGGYFEGRHMLPANFDAKFYQKNYPDVKVAIASGKTKSAQDHYMSQGFREWRLPCDESREQVAMWRKLLVK